MPLVVDKEKVRMDILMAFEKCMKTSPITNVSLRDIAKEAGMSHANLLNYFDSKDDIIVSYCKYTKDYFSENCKNWFKTHSRKRYQSNLSYLNALMAYVARTSRQGNAPIAPTQMYILGQYNPEIKRILKEEYNAWYKVMEDCLVEIYGEKVGKKEAVSLVVVVAGTFIVSNNGTLNDIDATSIISSLANLA